MRVFIKYSYLIFFSLSLCMQAAGSSVQSESRDFIKGFAIGASAAAVGCGVVKLLQLKKDKARKARAEMLARPAIPVMRPGIDRASTEAEKDIVRQGLVDSRHTLGARANPLVLTADQQTEKKRLIDEVDVGWENIDRAHNDREKEAFSLLYDAMARRDHDLNVVLHDNQISEAIEHLPVRLEFYLSKGLNPNKKYFQWGQIFMPYPEWDHGQRKGIMKIMKSLSLRPNYSQIREALLSKQRNPEKAYIPSLLEEAILMDRPDNARILLKHGADPEYVKARCSPEERAILDKALAEVRS